MLLLTKIFHFEMAHAICGYAGACRHVHGHSYELHVTFSSANENENDNYIPAPGFEIDFKVIKKLVTENVIKSFDHKLVLSKLFLAENPGFQSQENLVCWDAEPSAENLLLYIRQMLKKTLPPGIRIARLKLYETKDSYAEWIHSSAYN